MGPAAQRIFLSSSLVVLLISFLLVPGPQRAFAAPSNNVLILGPTVTNGTNSLEAQAIRAQGLNPVVVDASTWQGMSEAEFATYRSIVLGDPTCNPETNPSTYSAATASTGQWGPAVTGNVVVIGTDPVFHATVGGRPDADKLITSAMAFALADSTRTGAYMDLSCSYSNSGATPQPVPVLAPFGAFMVHGVGCEDNIDIVAQQAALAGVTNSDLNGWGCSVHEAFSSWPGPQSTGTSSAGDFLVLAIDINNGSSYRASDDSVGDPYILARGSGLIPITPSSPTYRCQDARFQFPTKGNVGWLYEDPRSQWDGPPNMNNGHIDNNDLKHPTIHVGVDFLPSSTDNRVWPLASGVIDRINSGGQSGNIWYNDAGSSEGVTTYITNLNFDPAIVQQFQSQGYVNVDPNTPIGTVGPLGHIHISFSAKRGTFDASYDDFNLAESQDPSSLFAANLSEPLGRNFQAYIEKNAQTDSPTGLVPVLPVTPAQLAAQPGQIDVVSYVPEPSNWNSNSSTGVWTNSFDNTKLRNPYPFSKTGDKFCNVAQGGSPSAPTPSQIINRPTPMITGGQASGGFWLDGALLGLRQLLSVIVGPVYSDVDLVLTQPDGTTITPTSPGVQYNKTGNFVTYTIQDAQTGEWTYTVIANALAPGGENVPIAAYESNGGPGLTDVTAPATESVVSPVPQNGVNNGPVTINFSAADNPGGSGVQSVTFGTSGAQNTPMTTVSGSSASLVVSATGTTTVYYFATDVAGNQEVLRSRNVQIGPSDTTPPAGTVSVVAGPPKQAIVTVQDSGSGLASIQVTESTNATYTVGTFAPGTTQPVAVTFTKVDQSQGAAFALTATDVAGNVAAIDPADVGVDRATGKPVPTTIPGIQGYERTVTIQNWTPGLTNLDLTVNGKHFTVADLKDGATATLDIGTALRPGGDNTVVLAPKGKPGGGAEVVVSGSTKP